MKLDCNIAALQEASPPGGEVVNEKSWAAATPPIVAEPSAQSGPGLRHSRAEASASACRTGAPATHKRRASVATRFTCARTNTPTIASARFLSTCTRRAPPSDRS